MLNNQAVKKKLIEKYGYKCSKCGVGSWLGEHLSLHMHHKDGDRKNNEESNLCLLCPNCHSQTETWCGRKLTGAKRPDLALRNTTPEMCGLSRARMKNNNPMANPEHRKTLSVVLSDGRRKGKNHWAYGTKRPDVAERNRARAGN